MNRTLLQGVRVIEMTGLAPVPHCGMVLADFGAHVTLIEKPHDAEGIAMEQRMAKRKTVHTLDLKSSEDLEVMRQLCRTTDVLLDPYRPGVLEKIGLDPLDLLKGQWKLSGSRTMVTICTYNARTLASESSIEDLLMQSRRMRYDIGLAETKRRHLFNAVYDTGEELFLGTCDSRGVGSIGVLVNTSLSMKIDSFIQLTTRIGHIRIKRCGSKPALTIFVVYAPTSNYDEEEVEPFYMDLERLYRVDHTFFKVIIGGFNAKIGPRRSSEERLMGPTD
uniref:Alpha-methylacyl-CoA racemase n=1 Tax=Angiostrongylus cantonensis TaxID=6313 RepID=A0A0K0D2L6_ANGCA